MVYYLKLYLKNQKFGDTQLLPLTLCTRHFHFMILANLAKGYIISCIPHIS